MARKWNIHSVQVLGDNDDFSLNWKVSSDAINLFRINEKKSSYSRLLHAWPKLK